MHYVIYVLSHLSLPIFYLQSTQPVPSLMLIPKSFDKCVLYRFLLAFQYVDNTHVCSELIRSRVLVVLSAP